MSRRFVTIWFRHLKTDWHTVRQPALRNTAFVLTQPDHGRKIITAVSPAAQEQGIETGMVLADARALLPMLTTLDDDPTLPERILKSIAKYLIRFTDTVAIDLPDGLILDVTGCSHLWGGEGNYILEINRQLKNRGYDIRATMADSIGCAWAVAHYGGKSPIVDCDKQMEALRTLPPSALRLKPEVTDRLYKLGLRQINQFMHMPRTALRRRFGSFTLLRIDQALGQEEEPIFPILPLEPFRERLPCLEPIVTVTGIEIALERLLESLALRLNREGKGIRNAVFTGFCIDHREEKIEIGTNRATTNTKHLFRLFEEKISSLEPGLGIELFMLEARKAEKISARQEKLWNGSGGLGDPAIAELMDKLSNRFGNSPLRRFVPDEHHWPERSYQIAPSFLDSGPVIWKVERPRPVLLFPKPHPIEVTAPIPDYPPMLFRYQGKLHKIKKADGPERIEPEWWIAEGKHRDYYTVEDEEGGRYWIFRAGHYVEDRSPSWFLHGLFA